MGELYTLSFHRSSNHRTPYKMEVVFLDQYVASGSQKENTAFLTEDPLTPHLSQILLSSLKEAFEKSH